MYLDFSNKQKEENAINSVKFQDLQRLFNESIKKNKILEDSLQNLNEEVNIYFSYLKIFSNLIIY